MFHCSPVELGFQDKTQDCSDNECGSGWGQIEVIDRNNLSRTYEYDTLNRQTKENWVGGGRSFTYQYNILNQLIDVTDQTATKQSEYVYG